MKPTSTPDPKLLQLGGDVPWVWGGARGDLTVNDDNMKDVAFASGKSTIRSIIGPEVQRSRGPEVQRSRGPRLCANGHEVVASRSRRTVTGPGLAAGTSRAELCRERRSHTCGRLLALLLAVPGLFAAAPSLVVAPTALLLGALGLFAPAPAAADVLVSNFGQTPDNSAHTIIPSQLRKGSAKVSWGTIFSLDGSNLAQQVTTGSNPQGYTLNSVELEFQRQRAESRIPIVELWSSSNSGTPNAKLFDLTGPASFPSGNNTYTFMAPQNTVLSANTSYFVLFYRGPSRGNGARNRASTQTSVTASVNEDSGRLSGWSIGNQLVYNYFDQTSRGRDGNGNVIWRKDAPYVARIRVNGSAASVTTGLTVTPGNAKLDLSWTAPSGTVTGYDVQYTSASKTGNSAVTDDAAVQTGNTATAATGWLAVTRSGTTATQAIASLSNGTTYRVRVRAKTSNGNGAWVFGTGAPKAPPAAPTNLSTSAEEESLTVTWTASTSTGTAAPTYYEVAFDVATRAVSELRYTARTESGTATSLTIDSDSSALPIEDGTQYRVTIRACNPVCSAYSGNETVWTPVKAPAVIANLVVTPGDETLALSWTLNFSGGPVVRGAPTVYEVAYTTSTTVDGDADVGTDPATEWVDAGYSDTNLATSYTITGLTNGQAYQVRVWPKRIVSSAQAESLPSRGFGTGTPEGTIRVTLGPSSVTVEEGKKALLNLG
ncbi:hypothetical protein BO98_02215, partial [Candidatus Synechococcus spongiarum LMB bulk10D]